MELWQIVVILVGGLVGGVLFRYRAQAGVFLIGIRQELKQVSWPSRDELVGSALVVFVGVLFLAMFISMCDFVLSKAVQVLLRSGPV